MSAEWLGDAIVVRGGELPEMLGVAPTGALTLGPGLVTTAGSWERSGDAARFLPRFPPVPGTAFAVVGRSSVDETWRELTRLRVPRTELVPRTSVLVIDPSVEEVPANLLRFSLTFSSIMEEGSAAGHVHVLDETGTVLPGTLLDMPPEFWDGGRRRLTVLIEPGRIKRGLQPNVQAGAPLREGGVVTLVVDSDIRDAEGAPLLEGARRTYRVGPAIRSRIDPSRWEVRWPESPTDPLTVRFDRPLDRPLVQRHLRVIDGNGKPVPGHASLDETALLWTFTPAADGGELRLRVDARLEDLAGNSVRRVFDRDLERAEDDGIDAPEVILRPDSRPKSSSTGRIRNGAPSTG